MATKLVPNPDFFLILKEVPESILTNEKTGAAVAKLGVQKACLIKYSSYFRGILPSGRFTNERDDNDIHLDVNEIFINNLILEIIHGVENQGFNRYERSRMKDILLECTHWGVDHIILSGWFTGWCAFASAADLLVCREHLSQGKLCACVEQQLLFPTYAFNHRALFMELTLRLVQYSSGRFHEDTYSEKPELMIPGRIISEF